MPPKLSKSAKQDLIVSHLRSTRTCHTLKDLEKMLPSVASINGIQVKEYIQNLADENMIRVEKIGSGNWYWCFSSDEKKVREAQLIQIRKEVEKARASCKEVGSSLASQMAKQEKEEDAGTDDGREREDLLRRKADLDKQVQHLQAEWKATTALTGDGGKTVQDKKAELETLRQTANLWTDNIYLLEEYLGSLVGGDREIMAAVQQECYGDEYVEGEGLPELPLLP